MTGEQEIIDNSVTLSGVPFAIVTVLWRQLSACIDGVRSQTGEVLQHKGNAHVPNRVEIDEWSNCIQGYSSGIGCALKLHNHKVYIYGVKTGVT